jgi:urease accessory protein
MIRAVHVLPAGSWKQKPADTVLLDYDQRHRRRMAMTAKAGTEFLLDLPQALPLRDGDGLEMDDGRIVAVKAAPEALAEITAGNASGLLRVAWHLGNRHLPTQLLGDRLRIRRDHVIEEMVAHLGAQVTAIEAPFDPEGGAYAFGGHTHHHPEHEAELLDHDDRLEE